ncbi:MAG: bifunctional hydroxymethylpyrimidine kinase/phosphomethylpyrimidine kinase, partial [Reyranella sp.]
MKGRVLIVAGSDSGGGAGIQADIKAVTAMNAFAATAITALTAQNTEGVHGVVAVEPAFIAQQIEVVLSDIGADALKTGMLHSAEVIGVVAAGLKKHASGVPLVVDPVMVAKGGHRLLLSDAETALRDVLLPMATLI